MLSLLLWAEEAGQDPQHILASLILGPVVTHLGVQPSQLLYFLPHFLSFLHPEPSPAERESKSKCELLGKAQLSFTG